MPPEPLPWDRKDFFKERKHDRPDPHHHHHHHLIGVGGGGYGGAGGFGSASRWREPPHPHPQSYYGSPRWASDFRYRPPPGYGKQGGRHLYSEDSSHGFAPSRPAERMPDRISDYEGSWASGTGKYIRSNRGYRGYKDLKDQYLEVSLSPNGPGRANGSAEKRRSADDMITCNSSQPKLESANSWDQSHVEEEHEKSGSMNISVSSEWILEREGSLGSIDWKPLKWSRSGSLSLRGSGFSHSSSSKSFGADSSEVKVDLILSSLSPGRSPCVDAALTPAPSKVSAAPSDETSSRKKPRLGWGEGLAKFEKKKVDPVDDNAAKNGTLCYSLSREPMHMPHSASLADKSPRINRLSDCASPATPSSAGCSSSPGLEEKQSTKSVHTDHDTFNMGLSPGIVSQNQIDGTTFYLENLDLAQSGHLSSAINNLLQSEDPSIVDSGFVKSTAINKLLVWKDDVLKKLEVTEGEIERLEVELKSLMVLPETNFLHSAAPISLPLDTISIPQEQDATSNSAQRQAPLELVSSQDSDEEKMPDIQGGDCSEVKLEEVDSPGSATLNFDIMRSEKDVFPSEKEPGVKDSSKKNMDKSPSFDLRSDHYVHEGSGDKISVYFDISEMVSSCSAHVDEFCLVGNRDHDICQSILVSNQKSANRAVKVFNKLLPTDPFSFDISNSSISSENDSLVRDLYLRRKRSVLFKERLISLKFRALQYLWKENVRSLSMRKLCVKSHKKFYPSLRTVCSSSLKQCSSTIRLRLPSVAWNLSLVPSNESNRYLSRLLSDCSVKPYRDNLKMPALILDQKEKMATRFISSNGLVEDPCAAEKDRSMINPWTSEEKEIFMDKFTTCGKDFTKIASYLVHKTTADCVEFYYKNHKYDWFKKTKKHPSVLQLGKKHSANNYLVASGKRWNYEAHAASLDMLGAASVIATKVDNGLEFQQKHSSNHMLRKSSDHKTSGDNGLSEQSSSLDVDSNERETVAADVLAGICGSLSSEALSSCITSAFEAGENYHEMKSHRAGSFSRQSLTAAEVTQSAEEETCSDESCGVIDHADWTDEEKSSFIQAVSSYGKDFTMISRCVRTRSRDQCKVFFSKARKCLRLDLICSGSSIVARDNGSGGGSDADNGCAVETGSVVCSEKSGDKMEVDLHAERDLAVPSAKPDLNQFNEHNEVLDSVDTELQSKNMVNLSQVCDKPAHRLDRDDNDGEVKSCSNIQGQRSVSIPVVEAVGQPCVQADRSDAPNDRVHAEKLLEHPDAESPGVVSLEIFRNDVKEKTNASTLDTDLSSAQQVSDNSCIGASENQSICDGLIGKQKPSQLHFVPSAVSVSVQNSCILPLQQKIFPVPINLVPQVSAVNCGEVPSKATSSFPQVMKINADHGHQAIMETNSEPGHQDIRVGQKFFSERSFLSSFGSSHILYPVPGSSIGDVKGQSSIRTVAFQRKLDSNNHQDQLLEREQFLQKCNGFKNQSSAAELPFRSLEVGGTNHSYTSSSSSLDAEKAGQNGDVKLFGQILSKPSLQQKGSGAQRNSDNENQPSVMSKQLSPRFFCDQAVNGSICHETKLDRHKLMSSENHPLRRYWDDSRLQNGLCYIPNSAMLLAKYPDAFGSYAMPSSNMEQLRLSSMNSSEKSLKGTTVFHAREIAGSNGASERHDGVLSEMQRKNGFDVTGVQQAAKGLVKINGRSILVGSQFTGVSDPVAAIKLHYSNGMGNK